MTDEQIDSASTGEVWLADESMAMGLIDAVVGPDDDKEDEEEEDETPESTGDDVAPVGALNPKEGIDMPKTDAATGQDTQNLERVGQENAELRAANEVLQAQLSAQKQVTCEGIIEKAQEEGRILPSTLKSVQSYAEVIGYDAEKLQKFVNGFPRQIHSSQNSVTPPVNNNNNNELTPEQKEANRAMGLSDEDYLRLQGKNGINSDGDFVDAEGRVIQ